MLISNGDVHNVNVITLWRYLVEKGKRQDDSKKVSWGQERDFEDGKDKHRGGIEDVGERRVTDGVNS